MKIYLFDTETGAFLGEDFADDDLVGHGRVLPAGATTVAPPEAAPGMIPFFCVTERCWAIHSSSLPRRLPRGQE